MDHPWEVSEVPESVLEVLDSVDQDLEVLDSVVLELAVDYPAHLTLLQLTPLLFKDQ